MAKDEFLKACYFKSQVLGRIFFQAIQFPFLHLILLQWVPSL